MVIGTSVTIMNLEFLQSFYHHMRNALLWFAIYFLLQTIIWIALAILIWYYPQALFILVVIFFCVLAIVSLYFSIVVFKYVYKLKKLKDLIVK